MEDVIKTIIEDGGWIALALICSLWIILRLTGRQDTDDRIVITQADVISRLVAQMENASEALRKVGETNVIVGESLVRVAELQNSHDQRVIEFRDGVVDAIARMEVKSKEREKQLAELPGKVRLEMADDFDNIPVAIERVLAPKIAELQKDITEGLKTLDVNLRENILNAIDKTPEKTAAMIRETLMEWQRGLEARIDEILNAIPVQETEPSTTETKED
jgi:hypothetical protein